MITKSLRYFLYARKSSENEDKQVASIPSQIEELKSLAKQYDLKIVGTLTEEKSAKAPGRPVFSQMIEDIHNGKADGIICWKLDRLARNPIDGGTISWMLQQSRIKHIQTFQRSYYPTDNVLMMNLEFGMANQFILDLSVNTKRGIRNKINDGWLPHKPPLGYLNNKYNQPDLPPIYTDPVAFPLMKQLWKILLEKRCSLDYLHCVAHKIGLKTYNNKIINRSSFYSLFKNPFYYGHILWQGEVHPGKHEPMITKSEFDEAQAILSGRRFPMSKQHVFAFTGLIRCGECGAGITAEEKFKHQKNGNKHHYTYYRCTKRIKRDCSQKPIRDTELEIQIVDVLKTINIPPTFHQWAIKYLKEEQSKEVVDREEIIQSQQRSLEACRKKLDNLFNMRVSGEIEAQEYNLKKKELMDERLKFEELLKDSRHRSETWLDRAEKLFSFAETAKKRFETGTLEDKRVILSTLGSNFTLKDKILSIPVDKRLSLFQTVAPEVQELHNRLEPRYPLDNIEIYERNYAKNKKWGRWLSEFRTCLLTNPVPLPLG